MHTSSTEKPILTEEEMHQIENLESWTKKVQSPLQHLERKYHGFVAYFVMPLFALGNAGVDFTRSVDLDYSLVFNIAAALFFGGCMGVTLFGWLSVKLGLATYPKGTNFGQFVGVAFLAGVGFTMSIFIANLAFWDSFILVESAKLGILIGSFLSGLTGYLIIRRFSGKEIEEEDKPSLF